MKRMLLALKVGGEIKIDAAGDRRMSYSISLDNEGSMFARRADSLTSSSENGTVAGLRRLLSWIDDN